MVYRAVYEGDSLQHWKYIRKYKNKKGNWTYVYADKETHNNITGKQRLAIGDLMVADQAAKDWQYYRDAVPIYSQLAIQAKSKEENKNYADALSNAREQVKVNEQMAIDYAYKAAHEIDQSYKLIEKNDIRAIPKNLVNKGKNVVNQVLRLFKKKNVNNTPNRPHSRTPSYGLGTVHVEAHKRTGWKK